MNFVKELAKVISDRIEIDIYIGMKDHTYLVVPNGDIKNQMLKVDVTATFQQGLFIYNATSVVDTNGCHLNRAQVDPKTLQELVRTFETVYGKIDRVMQEIGFSDNESLKSSIEEAIESFKINGQ